MTRRARILAAAAVCIALAAGFVGLRLVAPSGGSRSPLLGPAPARAEAAPSASPSIITLPIPETRPFATVRGLTLYLPVALPLLLGYHEASLPGTVRLTPLGRCVHDFNRTKFKKPTSTAGPDYLVMSSRGRPYPATSAADVAMRIHQPVLSPVSGTVESVKRYRLYDRYPDLRISFVPAADPSLRVVVIHVTGVLIHRGDQVVAGVTVIGTPRVFPFSSQVNDYVGPGIPHVHIEVKELGAPDLQASG
jgi:hypothetical protein